ncbi:hypothetical protein G5I_13858 [Acromyrmex echinatior]|uniref:Uncharacterized protein n=1 Tax=Acromyrmex echinatior TaxID=103372 RepID=F4X655_ACREC|nr:hypothetical protein G5I_13858 [Acromyrmex echinatior]
MPAKKSHSKERTSGVVERTQALISGDPGQSLRKISIDCCKRASNALNCRGKKSSIQIVYKESRRYLHAALASEPSIQPASQTHKTHILQPHSRAQLCRTAKVFVGDRMTEGVKRNVTEMRPHAAALKGGT